MSRNIGVLKAAIACAGFVELAAAETAAELGVLSRATLLAGVVRVGSRGGSVANFVVAHTGCSPTEAIVSTFQ